MAILPGVEHCPSKGQHQHLELAVGRARGHLKSASGPLWQLVISQSPVRGSLASMVSFRRGREEIYVGTHAARQNAGILGQYVKAGAHLLFSVDYFSWNAVDAA